MARSKKSGQSGRHSSDPQEGQHSPRPVKVPPASNTAAGMETTRGDFSDGDLYAYGEVKSCAVPDQTRSLDKTPEPMAGCSCRRPQELPAAGIYEEPPNKSSELGLIVPDVVPHTVEQIDAAARSRIGQTVIYLFAGILVLWLCAITAATFAGVPTEPLDGYFRTVMTTYVTPTVTLMLGYFFGAQHRKTRKKQS